MDDVLTFRLDAARQRKLDQIARMMATTRSEVLRRFIDAADGVPDRFVLVGVHDCGGKPERIGT